MMNPEQHFDNIAKEYDYWKNKNWYYYQNLKALYKSFIPPQSRVWEIGCGTGDILAALEPSGGYGTDTSRRMIEIAKLKYAASINLKFEARALAEVNTPQDYHYVVVADVLEHIRDLHRFFRALHSVINPGTKIVISVTNPLWEPLLMLAEKLKMKMPEGPHWRLSITQNETIFKESGFKITDKGHRLLVPKRMPGSEFINQTFHKNKILTKLGFLVYWVIEPH